MDYEITPAGVILRLNAAGLKCYYIGGYVRDALMGKASRDVDLATNADPDTIERIFKDRKIAFTDRKFGVCVIEKSIELSTFRKERVYGIYRKDSDITFADTIEEDLERRDFTINAMAMTYEGAVYDLFGGQDDLKKKIVKFVGKPKDRIVEDPIRMLRGCRLVSYIDGKFDKKTYKAIRNYCFLINTVPPEMIYTEIVKAVKAVKESSKFFKVMYKTGLLKYILPSLEASVGVLQNKHHKETLFEHMMDTGDFLPTFSFTLKMAGYLHDVGKLIAKEWDDNKKDFTLLKHEVYGHRIVNLELSRLRFPKNIKHQIVALIAVHMKSIPTSAKGIRKLLTLFDSLQIDYRDFVAILMADVVSKKNDDSKNQIEHKKLLLLKFRHMIYDMKKNNIALQLKDLAINGEDVMMSLHLKPGEKVGRALKYALDLVTEDPEKNDAHMLLNELVEADLEGKLGDEDTLDTL